MEEEKEYCKRCESHFDRETCKVCKNGNYYSELYDADEACKHKIISTWNGVKCEKCNGCFSF